MTDTRRFSAEVLRLDASRVIASIVGAIQEQVLRRLRRRGAVIGLSGGVDSSVTAALCVRALGPEHVFGLFMPEQDSDPASLRLGRQVAELLKIPTAMEDLSAILSAMGCYQRRDAFIRSILPEYDPENCKCKLVMPNTLDSRGYNIFYLVVEDRAGRQQRVRLPLASYLGIVAATNMKQRTRKQMEYFHADRLNFAVAGTPNRLEYEQGFFVKNGDGAADLKPIAHLYKTQVYQLAEALGLPEEIRQRTPTTDTFPLSQTQEEFFFPLPYEKMDLCLYGLNHGIEPGETAEAIGLRAEQVEQVYRDIQAKRRATRYQHTGALLVEPIPEVG